MRTVSRVKRTAFDGPPKSRSEPKKSADREKKPLPRSPEPSDGYRERFEDSLSGMFQLAPDGRFVEANLALSRLHGCSSVDEFMGAFGGQKARVYAEPSAWKAIRQRLRRRENVVGHQSEAVKKDGQRFWISESLRTVRSASGRLLGYEGSVEDIADFKRLEGKLKVRERMLSEKTILMQQLLNAIDEGICAYDNELRLIAFNSKYLDQTEPDEVVGIGMPLLEHLRYRARTGAYGSGDPNDVARRRLEEICGGELKRLEELRRPDGRITEVKRFPLPNGGFIVKFNDVTERHRAEDELLAAKELAEIANRGKTTFLAHLSHELRTPLNNILAFAEIMKDQLVKDDGGRYREYASYIYESGRVLLQLINDIVDIAKVEAGHVQLHPVPLDIERVIAASSRLLGAEFRSKGIIFSTRVPAESPPLTADEKSVRQILVNLLSNAAKFTRRGGRVAVSVKPEVSGYYVVEVQDTGVGIPKEDLQKVFMPFDHSDRDLAVRTHGTGLGLPLVKFLMELHGGSVSIDSDVGVGTTVALRFPARGPVRAA